MQYGLPCYFPVCTKCSIAGAIVPVSRSTDSKRFSAARSPGCMDCFLDRCRRYHSTRATSSSTAELKTAVSELRDRATAGRKIVA